MEPGFAAVVSTPTRLKELATPTRRRLEDDTPTRKRAFIHLLLGGEAREVIPADAACMGMMPDVASQDQVARVRLPAATAPAPLPNAVRQRIDKSLETHDFHLHPTFYASSVMVRSAYLLLDYLRGEPHTHRFDAQGLVYHKWLRDPAWRVLVFLSSLVLVFILPFWEAPCRSFDAVLPNNLKTCPTDVSASIAEGYALLPIHWIHCTLIYLSMGRKFFLADVWNVALILALCISSVDLIFSNALPLSAWPHPRILRVVRPIFMMASSPFTRATMVETCWTVVWSIPAVALLVLFIVIFSVIGYTAFGPDAYFTSSYDSFVSMMTVMTTANYPDVMLPAFRQSPWASVYFILFLTLTLFTGLSSVLATVTSIHRSNLQSRAAALYANNRAVLLLCFASMDVHQAGQFHRDEFIQLYMELSRIWHGRRWWRFRTYNAEEALQSATILFEEIDATRNRYLTLPEFLSVEELLVASLNGELLVDHSTQEPKEEGVCQRFLRSSAYSGIMLGLGVTNTALLLLFLDKLIFEQLPFQGQLSLVWDWDWVVMSLSFAEFILDSLNSAHGSMSLRRLSCCFVALAAAAGKVGADILMRGAQPRSAPLFQVLADAGQLSLLRFFSYSQRHCALQGLRCVAAWETACCGATSYFTGSAAHGCRRSCHLPSLHHLRDVSFLRGTVCRQSSSEWL